MSAHPPHPSPGTGRRAADPARRGGPAPDPATAASRPYRYFYDCEFVEDGHVIDLVSIGVVDEHGREFYAVSTEFDDSRALPWVRRNVLDKLPSPADPAWRSRERIRDDLYEFLVTPLRERRGDSIELWAWYAAYDHVALAQLWGNMPALPRVLPRFTKDLRQLWDDCGRPELPLAEADRHDALVDARHNLARWRTMLDARGRGELIS